MLPPKPVDQRTQADHPPCVDHEQGQQRPQPRATQLQHPAARLDLERAKHPELHTGGGHHRLRSVRRTHAVRIAYIAAAAARFASISHPLKSAEPDMSQRVVERFMGRTGVGQAGGAAEARLETGSARLGRWSRPVSPAFQGGGTGSNPVGGTTRELHVPWRLRWP